MNIFSALDPLLRFTRSKATPNLPSVLTPPFNPAAGSALPATLEQARAAMPPGVATAPNPATLPRPVNLPDRAQDMPVPAIKAPQFPSTASPEMTETRRVGAPVSHKQQALPLAQLSSLPEPPMLKAPSGADGHPLAARPAVPGQMEIPKTRSKFWDTLKGVGYGAMIGAQRNPNNPWAMLGGAAAGGIGTFKAPSNADLLHYEAITKPREQADALEQYQRDKMANDIALGREKTQTEREDRATRKVATETAKQREERLAKEAQERLALTQEREKRMSNDSQARVQLGKERLDLQRDKANAPKPMTAGDAAAELDAEEGTIDEIVGSSFNDARITSLLDKLSPRERGFVTGQMPPRLEDQDDVQYGRELGAANNKWQELQAKELARMVQETTRARRAGVQSRIAGSKGRAPAQTAKSRGPSGSKPTFPASRLEEYRKALGVATIEEARRQAEADGYVVK